MRKNGFFQLSEALSGALAGLDAGAGEELRAVMLWPDIVGPQVAAVSEAQRLRGGTLRVLVRDSVWNNQIALLKQEILRKYRKRLGPEIVRDLQCVVGKVRKSAGSAARAAPPPPELRRIALPQPELESIREAARCGDPELSQAIRRALTAEAQRRIWALEHGAKGCPRCGAAYRTVHRLCPACRQDEQTADAPL